MDKRLARNQIDSIANRLIQVVLSILPIGAAVIGLLTQQGFGLATYVMIGMIWLSILALSISALINLNLLRLPPTITDEDEDELHKTYDQGGKLFTLGIVLLMVSPVALVANIWNPVDPQIKMEVNNQISLTMPLDGKGIHAAAAITNQSDRSESLKIRLVSDSTGCIQFTPNTFSLDLDPGQTKLVDWQYSFSQNCMPGQYLVFMEAANRLQIASQTYIKIRIDG